MEGHAALKAAGFKLQSVCSTCAHWSPDSVAPECDSGTCTLADADVPAIGGCKRHYLDPVCLDMAAGAEYVALYKRDRVATCQGMGAQCAFEEGHDGGCDN